MATWVSSLAAVTLFVEDLDAARRFYQDIFELPVHYEDSNSAVFMFGDMMINLLKADKAPELIAPATVAPWESGHRFQFTVAVDDVDAMCKALAAKGVRLLSGPMDRPWGIRTASFQDPGGHIWEIAH